LSIRQILDPANYLDKGTILHKLDPRTKIAILLTFIFLSIVFDNVLILLFLLLVGVYFWHVSKIPLGSLRFAIYVVIASVVAWTFTGGFILWQGASSVTSVGFMPAQIWDMIHTNPHVLFSIGGLKFTAEGAFFGMERGLKLATPLVFTLVLWMTTGPTRFLNGLIKLGLPYKFAFTGTTALRFLPLFSEVSMNIVDAQRIRGAEEEGLFKSFKITRRLIEPLLINALRRARETAASVECRAFDPTGKGRTYLINPELTRSDKIVLVTLVMVCVIGFIAAFVYGIGVSSAQFIWEFLEHHQQSVAVLFL